MINLDQAQETIRRSRALRNAGRVEAVLRAELQSALRVIFPDERDRRWLDHYVEGAESLTKITRKGSAANRFIDNLVGSTTIEYEGDLRNNAKRDEGYRQVREHAAGQLRAGVPISQVRGVLSDTVEWHAYDAVLRDGVEPAQCTTDDIGLVEVDSLDLVDDSPASAERLVQFIRKHLAREQSRALKSEFLALDLGLESAPYKRSAPSLEQMVVRGRADDTSIALATDLWARFVDHFGSDGGDFRAAAYVDEAYVGILSRLLSANVLAGRPLSSDDAQLADILDGTHFKAEYQLENMVEQDYFGWLIRPGRVEQLLPIAREIQIDLYAYDFGHAAEEDLFGRLMAQLAGRSQRKLLGQEWTPSWLARELGERCLRGLPEGEPPRIVDMCCGSGAILAEVLKAARSMFALASIDDLRDVATGFDIDPLAVSLSKTTWVVTLASEIKAATAPVVIPVYNADSMFAVTPVSASVPMFGAKKPIVVTLDGTELKLPFQLVQPDMRDLFDRIIDWAYDEARHAQSQQVAEPLAEGDVAVFVANAADAVGVELSGDLKKAVVAAARELAQRMAALAVANRNGIWAFILRNAYRPGLLTGQFNGLVSNPPWLAMSGLADNPYRKDLTARAKVYGIRPAGQSFLHLELGTMHLVHAIDRYLQAGASVACLVPGTILNGDHHEPFRQAAYRSAKRPVAFRLEEVWRVAEGTFKYPGAALIGHKEPAPLPSEGEDIKGFSAEADGVHPKPFTISRIGDRRMAWSLDQGARLVSASGSGDLPQQGADLMPRTAVCVEILAESGAEYRVDTPAAGRRWSFTVKDSKELKGERFAGYAAPQFIYQIAQSVNLVSYVLGADRAPIVIPAERVGGVWQVYTDAEVRRRGFLQTARRLGQINAKLKDVGKGKSLQERIDERGKLTKQAFGTSGYLVLAGAGGKHISAACLPVSEVDRLVVDQTLYWQVVQNEDEAWFRVAMLNSAALTEAIMPFNPKGDFAERHVHTLPYRIMPPYDGSNETHRSIAALGKQVAGIAASIVTGDPYLSDPGRSLPVRRRRMRDRLAAVAQQQELERLCAAVLSGVSVEALLTDAEKD